MKLLWLDLETTGLDPDDDLVLEVCAVVTDMHLRKLGEYHAVVHHTEKRLNERLDANARVRKMHTDNGLLLEVPTGSPPDAVAADLRAFGRVHQVYGRGAYLAGRSVHFDRGFLRRFAPGFEAKLHHRHFDLSSLMSAMSVWGGFNARGFLDGAHRARSDVHNDIALAEAIRATIRRGR